MKVLRMYTRKYLQEIKEMSEAEIINLLLSGDRFEVQKNEYPESGYELEILTHVADGK